jgi:hypothetical protein
MHRIAPLVDIGANLTNRAFADSPSVTLRSRQRQHPLSDRHDRQHTIDEVRRRLGHASSCARRTQTPPLARERDPTLVTALATHAQEPIRQDPAVQQRAQLPTYESRHRASAILRALDEAREVALNRAVQRCLFRPPTHVAAWRRRASRRVHAIRRLRSVRQCPDE